jgi:predicted RNase H-like HicB family nuclease
MSAQVKQPSQRAYCRKSSDFGILTREDDGFVTLCPEVDVASQGGTVEEAKANLKEAVELFVGCASQDEIRQRMAGESYISAMEVQLA